MCSFHEIFPSIKLHCDDWIINGVSTNSKSVKPGYVFIVVNLNAELYIDEAINNGAKIVILREDAKNRILNYNDDVVFLYHKEPRMLYSQAVAKIYHNQPSVVCAVTGTNGKSSTVFIAQHLWNSIGKNALSIGTLGINSNVCDLNRENLLTTPDAIDLHKILHEAKNRDVDYAALEASSHGLDQFRLHYVALKAAAFTNISVDHLDYHQNMDEYLNAKIRLFNEILPPNAYAILNADIKEFFYISSSIRTKHIVTYGRNGNNLKLLMQKADVNGQNLEIQINNKIYKIFLPIFGLFQAYNLLTALGLILYSDHHIKFEDLNLTTLKNVPARLELIFDNHNKRVFLDYAHTPDALEKAILSLKSHFNCKITILFGCGGDRDQSKRSVMGNIATALADYVIITDDNPRNEDPKAIRMDIISGCKGSNFIEIANRAEAIEYAFKKINKGVLLIAGKGHENYQIILSAKIPYSDLDVVKTIANA